jgi:LPXTG-motif cell wall-anchored protein
MKKFMLGGFTAAGLLLGGLAITSGGAFADTNHPECDGTEYTDRGPNEGTSVTAEYTGTMSIKIGNDHYSIQVVAGETYGPDDVAAWPKSEGGNFQDISHVDYCVPETPPPPPEEEPTTTASTLPPEQPEPTPTPAPAEPVVTVAAAGPVPPAAAPAAAPAPAQSALPSTGSSSWGLALTALASLLGGLGLVKLSRRTS